MAQRAPYPLDAIGPKNNAIERLVADHRKLLRLLNKLQQPDELATLPPDAILDELEHELEQHARLEEMLFKPAFGATDDAYREHKREHQLASSAVEKLKASPPCSDQFVREARALHDFFDEHAAHEEHEVFPELARLLGGELSTPQNDD